MIVIVITAMYGGGGRVQDVAVFNNDVCSLYIIYIYELNIIIIIIIIIHNMIIFPDSLFVGPLVSVCARVVRVIVIITHTLTYIHKIHAIQL